MRSLDPPYRLDDKELRSSKLGKYILQEYNIHFTARKPETLRFAFPIFHWKIFLLISNVLDDKELEARKVHSTRLQYTVYSKEKPDVR